MSPLSASLHLPFPSCSPNYPKINKKNNKKNPKAVWKLTSPTATKSPQWKREGSERTAVTWTVPKPQCACLNPTESWSKVAWRNAPILHSWNRQEEKGEGEGEGKEKKRSKGEKTQQAGLNWLGSFRGQQSSTYKCLWLVLTLRHSPGQELK